MSAVPDSLAYTDAEVAETKLTLENVSTWVERFSRHRGRLRFFADLTPTAYFEAHADCLLRSYSETTLVNQDDRLHLG